MLLSVEARNAQLFCWPRNEKITAGVKIGIRAGMTAHHSWGLAVRKTAATSMADTTHKRTAILCAQERTGSTRIETSLSAMKYSNS